MKNKKALRPENLALYSYWHALYLSFYSGSLYVDVAKRWKGFGFLYLWLVVSIGTIPLAARAIIDFNHYFNEKVVLPIQLLPPILVQNGEVKFDKPMPYKLKNNKGEIVSIIDTTGEITKITPEYPYLTVLMTKNQIMFKSPKVSFFNTASGPAGGDNVYVSSLGRDVNEVFDGGNWIESNRIYQLKLFSQLLIYPLLMMFFLAILYSLLLLVTLLAQLIARTFFDLKLTFKQTCRLLAVSATPQTTLNMTAFTVNAVFPGLGLVCLALQAIYFSFAIIVVKRSLMKLARR